MEVIRAMAADEKSAAKPSSNTIQSSVVKLTQNSRNQERVVESTLPEEQTRVVVQECQAGELLSANRERGPKSTLCVGSPEAIYV